MNNPTLHKPVPMNVRVVIPEHYHTGKTPKYGKVVGISACHVIFTYIVLLDEPMPSEYGPLGALVVNGPELVGVDGENWRLEKT
jgi:hypothetical protein